MKCKFWPGLFRICTAETERTWNFVYSWRWQKSLRSLFTLGGSCKSTQEIFFPFSSYLLAKSALHLSIREGESYHLQGCVEGKLLADSDERTDINLSFISQLELLSKSRCCTKLTHTFWLIGLENSTIFVVLSCMNDGRQRELRHYHTGSAASFTKQSSNVRYFGFTPHFILTRSCSERVSLCNMRTCIYFCLIYSKREKDRGADEGMTVCSCYYISDNKNLTLGCLIILIVHVKKATANC